VICDAARGPSRDQPVSAPGHSSFLQPWELVLAMEIKVWREGYIKSAFSLRQEKTESGSGLCL